MSATKDKPRSVTRKPSATPVQAAALDSFLEGGVDAPPKKSAGNKREKKVSTPLIIPPALKSELEAYIESLGTGVSRSTWICGAIREKLERDRKAGE